MVITYNSREKEGTVKNRNPYTLNEIMAMRQGYTSGHDHKPNPIMYGSDDGTAKSEIMEFDELVNNATITNNELREKYGARNAAVISRIMASENAMRDYYRGDLKEVKDFLHDATDTWADTFVEFVDIERDHYFEEIVIPKLAKDPRISQREEDSKFGGVCI